MITTTAKFSAIASDVFLRFDVKYHQIESACGYNIFGVPADAQILLSDILKEDHLNFNYEDGRDYKGIPTGQAYIDEDGDIIDYQPVTIDDHPERLKYALTNDHILISSLRLAKSPALMFDTLDLSEYVFSNGFYSFVVSNDWNKKYVLYLLRIKALKSIIDCNIYRGIGISSYKVNDLLRIPVRNISKLEQELTVKKIEPIELKIAALKRSKSSIQETIDSIFQREFGFDYDKFEDLKSHKYYSTQQAMFSNNPDLRFSVKYHRPAGEFVMKQLTEITDKKIKHFIAEPIVLGASVSPKDYDESGEYSYISMATIKSWCFDAEAASTVSDSYSAQKLAKTVQKNDIILARSGEGTIGKVAIITDEDPKGIFADFTMRIRLNENSYNPTFAYYFMRSCYFQYLIEIYKKGLGNNTNIFPIVIQEFPIPDISLKEQQRIVDEIQSEIKKQDDIKAKIAELRSQIDDIIIKTIKE